MSERDYLKGVPLRLGKSFYPLARPQFKEIDIHIPLDALQDEYDFGLEKVVIETFETYQVEKERLRLKEEKWRREKAEADALEQERLEKLRQEAEEIARKEQEEKQRLQEELAAAAAVEKSKISQSREIQPLQPQPHYCRTSDSVGRRSVSPINSSSSSKGPNSSQWSRNVNLNLSDFENDTANPFDSAEINSINDKAELASIWANSTDLNGATITRTSVPSIESKSPDTSPTHQSHPQTHAHPHVHMNGSPSPTNVLSHGHSYYSADNSQTPGFSGWQQQWDARGVLPPPYPGPLPLPIVTATGAVGPRTSASTMPLLTNGVPLAAAAVTTSSSTLNPIAPPPVSNVNSFTKIHFPFLTNYTQTNRERDRAAERIYHQQFNSIQRPLQQFTVAAAAASSPSNIGLGLPPPHDQIPATGTGPRPSITPNQNYGGVSFPNRNVI